MRYVDGPRPRLFGHRGASGSMPENTLPAFTAALAAGADRLELDVHLSRDEHVIVFHDEEIARTTDGAGPIARMSLAEIRELDAGHTFEGAGGAYPFRGRGFRVPTFAEVLSSFPEVPLNVEIKVDDVALIDGVKSLLERHGAMERVLLAAETAGLMDRIREKIPGAITGMSAGESIEFLCRGGSASYRPRGFALQLPVALPGVPIITPYFVEVAHASGLEVHAWTINDEAEARALVEMGVDGIMTDFPDRIARAIGRGGG